jgi:hypothetical protein
VEESEDERSGSRRRVNQIERRNETKGYAILLRNQKDNSKENKDRGNRFTEVAPRYRSEKRK